MRGQGFKLVGCGDKGVAGLSGDLGCKFLGKTDLGVDPGADRRAALRQFEHAGQRRFDAGDAVFDLLGIARKFLPERHRGRILQMGAADLDDIGKFARLGIQRAVQLAQRRDQLIDRLARRRDVHGGGEGIIG